MLPARDGLFNQAKRITSYGLRRNFTVLDSVHTITTFD